MQDRIPGGRFVNEGLRVTCDNRSFDVESSSLCAVVADVQQKTVWQLSLHIKIPYLNVAQPILGIDGVIVRDRRGRSARESVDECQITRGGIRDRVRFRDGKGWVKRKILNHRSVLREVVVDSIPEPNYRLLQGPPCQSEPRRSVRTPAAIIAGGKRRKNSRPVRVSRRAKAFENAAVVSAEPPVVLATVPRDGIGDRVGLIQCAARRRIAPSAKRREAQARQP